MAHIPGSEGAGHTGYSLTLQNTGTTKCRLGSHPGLQLLQANGASLPTTVSQVGASSTVEIAPGATASANLRFSPDIPSGGEPQSGPCEPPAAQVRVKIDPFALNTVLGQVSPPTSVCGHGAISEQPLG